MSEEKEMSVGFFRSIFNEVMAKYNGSLHKTLQVLRISRDTAADFLQKEDEEVLHKGFSREILKMYKFDQQYPLSVKKTKNKKGE